MRETQIGASEGLQHCLVEEEGASLRSSGRRRLSFVVSVALQAAALAAALAVPLLVNGEKLRVTMLTPVQPVIGCPSAPPRTPPSPGEVSGRPVGGGSYVPDFQQPRIPATEATPDEWLSTPEQPGSRLPGGQGFLDGLIHGPGESSRSGPQPPLPVKPDPPKPTERIIQTHIDPGQMLYRVEPVYPVLAKHQRLEGKVHLRAIIGRDGLIRELEVISGHPLFIRAATDAIRQWRYRPTLLNGQPVEVETQITVVFTLR